MCSNITVPVLPADSDLDTFVVGATGCDCPDIATVDAVPNE